MSLTCCDHRKYKMRDLIEDTIGDQIEDQVDDFTCCVLRPAAKEG